MENQFATGWLSALVSWLSRESNHVLLILASTIFVGFMLRIINFNIGSVDSTPIVNKPRLGSLFSFTAKWKFINHSKEIIEKAVKKYPNKAFRVMTDWGQVLMLPPQFTEAIRNNPHLSFQKAASVDGHANIPGFETVKLISDPSNLVQAVTRKQLTRHLSVVIRPLNDVTDDALVLNFGNSTDWHDVDLKPAVLDIIARLSSRIYFGELLYQNEAWISTVKNYASTFFIASSELRRVPQMLRPLVHWFIPSCKTLRQELYNARCLTKQYMKDRLRDQISTSNDPNSTIVIQDVIQWAETEAKARGTKYDPATFQLTLSLLAIHTTYDLLQMCIVHLAQRPDCIQQLRKEIVEALHIDGWTKHALYRMKLLDSAIKESQRLKPGSITSMRRCATSNVLLPNGLSLKKGERLNVLTLHRSSDIYQSPDTYDPYRFYNLRMQPGNENWTQLVSTSVKHMGFGHGEHSCPGRFFAANEIKIALSHIIVKYDWKLISDTSVNTEVKGMIEKASGKVKVIMKRRAEVEAIFDKPS